MFVTLLLNSASLYAQESNNKSDTFVRYTWSYDVKGGSDTNWTTCKNQFGSVGSAKKCKTDGTCNKQRLIEGLCLVRHGKGHTQSGSRRSVIKDIWHYRIIPSNTHYFVCTVNGKDIGESSSCETSGTCENKNAIQGFCAAEYGNEV